MAKEGKETKRKKIKKRMENEEEGEEERDRANEIPRRTKPYNGDTEKHMHMHYAGFPDVSVL